MLGISARGGDVRRSQRADVTLFQDAELQTLLRELRYRPVRGLYGERSRDAAALRARDANGVSF